MNFSLLLNIVTSSLFVYKIFEDRICDYLSTKKTKLSNLKKLVSSQHDNLAVVYLTMGQMLAKATYLSLIQYFTNTVEIVDKNTYLVSFTIDGKLYKFKGKMKRGPSPVSRIMNDKNQDITHIILPYLGSEYNWYGTQYTLDFFETKSLTFELNKIEPITITFSEDNFCVDFTKIKDLEFDEIVELFKLVKNSKVRT